jgi:hypothetical protein
MLSLKIIFSLSRLRASLWMSQLASKTRTMTAEMDIRLYFILILLSRIAALLVILLYNSSGKKAILKLV